MTIWSAKLEQPLATEIWTPKLIGLKLVQNQLQKRAKDPDSKWLGRE